MVTDAQARLLVLHTLRLKGFAADQVVVDRSGLTAGDATSVLEKLRADELVVHREGRLTGWALTPAGRAAHAELIAAELDGASCRERVDDAYRQFLALNAEMLAVCTDWQVRADDSTGRTPNEHDDPAYDAAVIARLGAVDDRAQAVCRELAGCLPRLRGYGERLAAARVKVEGGDRDWFTKPLIDSYHTVWFELHEDLLVTLGIERTSEGSE